MTSPEALSDVDRRRGPMARIVAVMVGVLAIGLVLTLARAPSAATRLASSPLLGKPVPPVSGTTIDGDHFDLADLRGRWVLVNVFATWCVPCRIEHPELVRFETVHQVRGDAAVVGIVYDDDPGAVRRFRDAEGGNWPMLVDPEGRIALDLGVSGVPESFLVAPNGLVAAKIVGGVRFEDLEKLLATLRDPPTQEERT